MSEPRFPLRSREQIASDTRAELEAWIEARAADLTAQGLSPGEAERRAREEFGDAGAAQRYAERQDIAADRYVRLQVSIEELWADVRVALRTLRRSPTVSTVVLLTFAIGVGAATAVFSVVHAMLLRPLPYGNEEALVQLQPVENGVTKPVARYSAAAIEALRERTTSFAGLAYVETGNSTIIVDGNPEQVAGAALSQNGFDVLGGRAAIGRTFGTHDAVGGGTRPVVLLDSFWRRKFGATPDIIGRTIELSGTRSEVIGVMPARFRVPTYEASEYLTPRDLSSLLRNQNAAQIRAFRVFGRLAPGVSIHVAQTDVDRVMRSLQAEHPRAFGDLGTRLVPIRAAVAGDARPRLLVLMGAATFVLLLVCANVAGVLWSRALARRHELSVRVALGGGGGRLIRQFVVEGLVLAIPSAVLGLAVAQVGIIALRNIVVEALPPGTAFGLEPGVLMFAVGVTIIAACGTALLPAIAGTKTDSTAFMRDNGRVAPSRLSRRWRVGLVAAQLAISVMLLVGSGLLLRTLQRLSTLDVGYETEQSLTFRLAFGRSMSNVAQDAFWELLYQHLRAIPGVVSAGAGNVPMAGQSTIIGLAIDGRSVEQGRLPDVRYATASDEYFAALGVPLLRGRTFDATDRDGAPWVAVVSRNLAQQQWPDTDPIGARVKVAPEKPWATVVGVVGDVRSGAMDPPVPSLYTSQRQDHWPGGGTVVVRAAGDPALLIAAVRDAVKRVDPTLPIVGIRTLEDFRRSTPAIAERRLQMQLLVVFALIALAVSAIGVYGVSAYSAQARHREFGVRLALGASPRSLIGLVLRDSIHAVATGAVVGVVLASLLAVRLRYMLFAVEPVDPPTVGIVLIILTAVVMIASLIPARRAAAIDPAQTMRAD